MGLIKKRPWYDKVVITTIPHYCAIVFMLSPIPIYIFYAFIATISSTLSITWHLSGEKPGRLMTVDYIFASLWAFTEIYITLLFFRNDVLCMIYITLFNVVNLYTNKLVDKYSFGEERWFNYDTGHSVWHIFSAIKYSVCAWLIRPISS